MEETTSTTPTTSVTEAQALQIIKAGVTREVKFDVSRTMAYCQDATKLRGFNVRKLAQKLEARAEDAGEPTFNSDSYQSNISTANGVMGLFDYDLDAFKVWFDESPTKSLKAIFNAFRELFVPKPAKPESEAGDGDNGEAGNGEPTPAIDVVLSLLPHLTADERMLVAMMIIELDTADDVVETSNDEDANAVAA